MRRGHVAPQNTFLDTIIRKFEGQSEWGRGPAGRGLWGQAELSRVWMGGVPGPCASGKCESLGGGVALRRWPGVAWARLGAGGRGLGAKGPAVGACGGRLRSHFQDPGVCVTP